MIDDPEKNGVPFLNAWHHFAFDMAGLITFVVVFTLFEKFVLSRPNNRFQQTSALTRRRS